MVQAYLTLSLGSWSQNVNIKHGCVSKLEVSKQITGSYEHYRTLTGFTGVWRAHK